MTREAECIGPNDCIATAAQKMKDLDVGALPVCNDTDRLAGMITDRDITIRVTADCCSPTDTYVKDAMTPNIVYAFDEQDVEQAARLMKDNQIRRLPVINRNKRFVGIVSLGDLAIETGDNELAGATLQAVCEPV
jgi:CBS domain-containing protein